MADPGYHVEVHGNVEGNLVVGDHNLIVNAAVGSSVQVIQEALRPKPVRRPRPRVLPRRPTSAPLGRDEERGAIVAAVVAGTSFQVYGESGMGKSTLLRQAAYDLADEADVVFVPVSGRSHLDVPQEIFEACYDASGYKPGTSELARLMAGVRVCVLADDLECSPDEVRAVMDAVPDASFVFSATERELWGEGRTVELSGLPAEAALALVRRELGRELTATESQSALAQWRIGGGSPMRLLRTVAALGQARTAEAPPGPARGVASAPQGGPGAVGAGSGGSGAVAGAGIGGAGAVPGGSGVGPGGLGAVAGAGAMGVGADGSGAGEGAGPPVDFSKPVDAAALVAGLSSRQADVVGLLRAVGRARVTAPVIAALAGAPDLARVAGAAQHLVAAGLADEAEDGFRLAADVAEMDGAARYRRDSAELTAAMLAWLEDPARTAREAAGQGAVVVSLVDAATRDGHAELATRLARRAAPMLALSLRWGAWRDVLTSGQAAAQAAGDREGVAYFTHERGIRMLCLGQATAAAVLATAAGLWAALGMHHSAAVAAQAQSLAAGHAAGVAHVAGQAGAGHAAGQAGAGHAAGQVGTGHGAGQGFQGLAGGHGAGAGGAAGSGGPAGSGAGSGPAGSGVGQGGPGGQGGSGAGHGAGGAGQGGGPAGSGGQSGPGGQGPGGPSGQPTPPRPPQPPGGRGARRTGRAVGKAAVPKPRHVPVALISTVAGVVVLAVVAALVVPHLLRKKHPDARPTFTPSITVSTPVSPPPSSLPPPVAFSDTSNPNSDPNWVLDGSPRTFWTGFPERDPKAAEWIGIDMGGARPWTGMVITPRNGRIGFPRAYRIESSDDGLNWTPVPGQDYNEDQEPSPSPSSVEGPVTLLFDPPVNARYLRLYAYELGIVSSPIAVETAPTYALQINEIEVLG